MEDKILLFNPATNSLHIAEYTKGLDITIPAPIRKLCKRDVEDVIVFKKGTRRCSNYDDFKHKEEKKRILD